MKNRQNLFHYYVFMRDFAWLRVGNVYHDRLELLSIQIGHKHHALHMDGERPATEMVAIRRP